MNFLFRFHNVTFSAGVVNPFTIWLNSITTHCPAECIMDISNAIRIYKMEVKKQKDKLMKVNEEKEIAKNKAFVIDKKD